MAGPSPGGDPSTESFANPPAHMSELVSYIKKINAELEDALGALNQQEFGSFFEIVVLELLRRTGKTLGDARDRHTNLE